MPGVFWKMAPTGELAFLNWRTGKRDMLILMMRMCNACQYM